MHITIMANKQLKICTVEEFHLKRDDYYLVANTCHPNITLIVPQGMNYICEVKTIPN